MGIYDGYFEIKTENNGVFIELFPAGNNGINVTLDDIVEELKKQNIDNFDLEKIKSEISDISEHKRIKVDTLERQDSMGREGNSDKMVIVNASKDNMKVLVIFYPGETKEQRPTVDEIVREVRKLNIVVDIDESNLTSILSDYEFNVSYEIGSGQPPIDGKPNKVIRHFKTKDDCKPELDEEGNVNYHKLNLVSNVKENQLLAELETGIIGVDGVDIYGKVVPAKKPKIVKILRGKNTKFNEDFTKLYAETEGLVKVDAGKIFVNEVYEVPNNVGVSTGDIEFNGTVIVHGSITSGFNVKAKGDIEVMGVIESSVVEAGGMITAHRGIQGGSNCTVVAKSDIHAKYIENADVKSGGGIHSEAILHSTVSASEEVIVEGKKGMISGGSVRSGIKVSAKILGSHMGTVTKIDVGVDPFVIEEYNEIKKTLPKIKNEIEKLDQVISLLNKKKEIEGQLDEKKQEMYVSATRNKILLSNKVNITQRKYLELHEIVGSKNDGRVPVRGTVYPGVKISIGNAAYYVKDAIQYVEFVKSGVDIKLESL